MTLANQYTVLGSSEVNISTLSLIPEEQEALQLVLKKKRMRNILNNILFKTSEYQILAKYYYPIFLVYGKATIKRFAVGWDTKKHAYGFDGLTGRIAEVDFNLPNRINSTVNRHFLLEAEFTEQEIIKRGNVFLRKHIERKYRPTDVELYKIEKIEKFYLPYFVIERDNIEVFAVDCLTKRVDPVKEIPQMEILLRILKQPK